MPKGPSRGDPKHNGKGRGGGVEDGTIAVVDGVMHLFPTELGNCSSAEDAKNPAGGVAACEVYYYWHTRVGHWTAPVADRLNWTRHEPVTPRSGLDGCASTTGIERQHHNEYWSGSPQWDEATGRWYITYVGYNQQCVAGQGNGGDGRILIARSEVAGRRGIDGPYKELANITAVGGIINRTNAQPWEAWAPEGADLAERLEECGIASFSSSLHSALPGDPPNRLWAFYGSSGNVNKTQNPSPSLPWGVGQCYSDHGVLGPWVRHKNNPVPLGGGIENPLVMRAKCGIFLLVFADNRLGSSLGFGTFTAKACVSTG